MNKTLCVMFASSLFISAPVFAQTSIVEGTQAATSYAQEKGTALVLAQKNKSFILRDPKGHETPMPMEITLHAGDPLYIANEEEMNIHNVYDLSDSTWVLKRQLPGSIAAVTFSEPGEHILRCAIHPQMEVKVNVAAK